MASYVDLNSIIKEGNLERVVEYIRSSNITADDHRQCQFNLHSPVYVAAMSGHVDIMRYLISVGFDFTTAEFHPSAYGFLHFPIHIAALQGHLDVVKSLVEEYKVDVNFDGDVADRVPLWFAIVGGSYEVVKYFISRGASVNERFPEPYISPLYQAVASDHPDICRLLITQGADLNDAALSQCILFHAVAGSIETVEILLDAGVDINIRDRDGSTPFMFAALEKNISMMQFLISRGADPYIRTDKGKTALNFAIETRNFDAVHYLVIELNMTLMLSTNHDYEHIFSNMPINVLKLLMRSSHVVSRAIYERLEEAYDSGVVTNCQEMMKYLRQSLDSPRSLQELTYLRIRHLLGRRISKARYLPLPNSLLDLIELKHI